MKAAERLDLARKLAGIGSDEGAGARIDQRRRDGERRALVASGGERRNDLQNGPAGERRVRSAPERRERVDSHLRLRIGARAPARLTAAPGSAKAPRPAKRPRPAKPARV